VWYAYILLTVQTKVLYLNEHNLCCSEIEDKFSVTVKERELKINLQPESEGRFIIAEV
jgi:hypothetical protein